MLIFSNLLHAQIFKARGSKSRNSCFFGKIVTLLRRSRQHPSKNSSTGPILRPRMASSRKFTSFWRVLEKSEMSNQCSRRQSSALPASRGVPEASLESPLTLPTRRPNQRPPRGRQPRGKGTLAGGATLCQTVSSAGVSRHAEVYASACVPR